jgi:hypothetical protein
MKKVITLVALLILVIGVQWFRLSQQGRDIRILRHAQAEAERSRVDVEKEIESATKWGEDETRSLRSEVVRLRGLLDAVRRELQDCTNRLTDNPPRLAGENASASSPVPVVLTSNDVDPNSVRVWGPDEHPNMVVHLVGKSHDEIEALRRGPADIIVNGVVVAHGRYGSGAALSNGTNIGLLWVLGSREEADVVATALGTNISNIWIAK